MKKTGFFIKLEWKNHPTVREPRKALASMLKVLARYPSVECDNLTPLGYTSLDLKRHVEKHFQPGMDWGNSHSWHLEHIVPIKDNIAFGITDLDKIHGLKNLTPVWDVQKPIRAAGEISERRKQYNREYMANYRKRPEQLAYQREYHRARQAPIPT